MYIANALYTKFSSLIIFGNNPDFTTEHFSAQLLLHQVYVSQEHLMYLLDILLILVRTLKMVYLSYMKLFKTKMHREELETNPPFFFLYHPFSIPERMRLAFALGKSGTLVRTLNQFWNERWSFLFPSHSRFTPIFGNKMFDSPQTAERNQLRSQKS